MVYFMQPFRWLPDVDFRYREFFGVMKKSSSFKEFVRYIINFLFPADTRNYRNFGWRNVQPASNLGRGNIGGRTEPEVVKAGEAKKYDRYTIAEVKAYLRNWQKGERARAVLQEASQFSRLIDERMRRYFRGRDRIFERLGYILYEYTKGTDVKEIARKVSYFADSDDIEDTMDFVAAIITNRLNRANHPSFLF